MSTLDVGGALRRLGWPPAVPTTTAVRAFQATTGLVVDGIAGPITINRIRLATARLLGGQTTLSAHFSFREFRCGCGGHREGCAGILALPALVAGLERVRAEIVQGPILLRSGYRCPAHNAAVEGAAKGSQHQWGAAADGRFGTLALVRALGVFSGVGRNEAGEVLHVDVRHVSGHNPPPPARGTVDVPATWVYS